MEVNTPPAVTSGFNLAESLQGLSIRAQERSQGFHLYPKLLLVTTGVYGVWRNTTLEKIVINDMREAPSKEPSR